MRSLVANSLLALLLVAAFTPAAQAQPTPSMSVAVSGLPGEITGLSSNNTTAVKVKVDVTVRNVVCAQAASVEVTLSVDAKAPPFAPVTIEPATLSIPIAQGQYLASPASGSAEAELKITMKEITDNATVPITVKASAAPPACQGAGGALTAQEGSAATNATIVAPTPPPPPPPPENDSPGAGVFLGVLAAVVAASFRRRRSA